MRIINEWVYLAKTERLETAKELIFDKCYQPILNSIYYEVFSKLWYVPIQKEDLGFHIYRGIMKAIYSYNYTSNKSVHFFVWAKKICHGECMNLLRTLTSNKNNISNLMYSYDVFDSNIIEKIAGTNEETEELDNKTDYSSKLSLLRKKLNSIELQVLEEKLNGSKNSKIAQKMGINSKRVSNIYEKIKRIAKNDL